MKTTLILLAFSLCAGAYPAKAADLDADEQGLQIPQVPAPVEVRMDAAAAAGAVRCGYGSCPAGTRCVQGKCPAHSQCLADPFWCVPVKQGTPPQPSERIVPRPVTTKCVACKKRLGGASTYTMVDPCQAACVDDERRVRPIVAPPAGDRCAQCQEEQRQHPSLMVTDPCARVCPVVITPECAQCREVNGRHQNASVVDPCWRVCRG